jgi:tyrosyl-tRNA synthetase
MTAEDQARLLSRGAEEILPDGELLRRLRQREREGRPLRVKQGFDPTAPDIHLGHTVGLRKLRQFQELGHQVVLIVGDYTGMVGDPSGRTRTRPQLTREQVEENAHTYLDQFFRVLDREPRPPMMPVEIHRNGEWFSDMRFMDVIRLCAHHTVARMLERDDFTERMAARHPIGIHELLYPLMQGYDSVAIQADVELGGTDQKFNLLVGRALQEIHGQPPQVVLTLPLLAGLDGVQRMSKSLGNYIGVTDPPDEFYGKVMSLPDGIMPAYWRLVADLPDAELEAVNRALSDPAVNPMAVKKQLARRLVTLYHGEGAADAAQRNFETQFSRRAVPDDLEEFHREQVVAALGHSPRPTVVEFLVGSGIADSKSAARRLVAQGAVSVDGARVNDIAAPLDPESVFVLRAGRRMKRYRPRPASGQEG